MVLHMYYVIMVEIDNVKKYVYSNNVFVENIGLARKFYSRAYARRYIKTHAAVNACRHELVELYSAVM